MNGLLDFADRLKRYGSPYNPMQSADYEYRLRTPGYQEYAQESRARTGLDTPLGLLSLAGIPVVSDAAGFAQDVGALSQNPTLAGAGLAAVGLLPGVPGGLGTIAGKAAKTADLDMLDIARKAEKSGLPKDRIFDATGWYRGKDGQWRYEIDDSSSQISEPIASGDVLSWKPDVNRADNIYRQESLYQAYPQLGSIPVKGDMSRDPYTQHVRRKMHGNYLPGGLGITLSTYPQRARSTMAHELQHGVQDVEKFATGSNPWKARSMISNINGLSDYDIYRRLAGEVEARNVQKRLGLLADDRRMLPPWLTEDVAQSEQLVIKP